MQILNKIKVTRDVKFSIVYVFLGILLTSLFFVKAVPLINQLKQKTLKSSGKIIDPKMVTSEEIIITGVVKKAIPSVVTIGIDKTIEQLPSYRYNPFDPFSPLQQIPGKTQQIKQNIGSGFIVSDDGLIITNKHVVSDTDAKYKVIADNDKIYDVVNIYRDRVNDLAILKIDAKDLTALELGESSNLLLGQTVVAVGTPLGEFKNTVTTGIISGLGRGITAGSYYKNDAEKLENVIQTDAAISPGNSGGPLLNSSAQVIGVNAAIASEGQNIGFAIPINEVKKLMEIFNNRGGSFTQPFLGVHYKMLPKDLAVLNDLPQGAYVIDIQAESPAEKAKIKPGDIILELDGIKLNGISETQLTEIISTKKVGQEIEVKYWRENKIVTLKVKLGEFK